MAFLQIYKPYGLILDQPYVSITPFPVEFAEYFLYSSLAVELIQMKSMMVQISVMKIRS